MTTLSDVTIIGGGIIGLLTARECVQAGASVTILDKGQIGQESSWAGGGILLPLYPWRQPAAITQLVLQSLSLYPTLTQALYNNSGIDPELLNSGLLLTKNIDIEKAIAWCTDNQVTYTLDAPAELSVQFSHAFDAPLWLPGICQARNPRLLRALQLDLQIKGVRFETDSALLDIQHKGHQVHSITTTTGRRPVKQLVLTTGAWTGSLWQQLFLESTLPKPNIYPVKGQMILFDAQPSTLKAIVLDSDRYLIPRKDGKILAGSTVEYVDFDKSTTPEMQRALKAFALQLLPALQHSPIIKHWAGLRPGSAEGIPYIAKHPEIENLSINAGHFRNGFAMGPASAQLLVDLLLNRSPKLSPIPYQLFGLPS